MTDPTPQNPLRMKCILESNRLGLAEDLKRKIFELDWVFSSAFDKLFLVAMLVWSVYAIWRIFF